MKYLDAINYGNKSLKLSNIQTYNLDSELLLAKVLNCTRESLLINLHKNLENKYFINFKKLIIRRMKFDVVHRDFLPRLYCEPTRGSWSFLKLSSLRARKHTQVLPFKL